MLLTKSWSPELMKILLPVSLYEPSAWVSALVRSNPKSVPQWASVKHMVAVHSPLVSLGKNNACCSGVPWACRHS